jgi:hypothetical protein
MLRSITVSSVLLLGLTSAACATSGVDEPTDTSDARQTRSACPASRELVRSAFARVLPNANVSVTQCEGGPMEIRWNGYDDTVVVEQAAEPTRLSYRVYRRAVPARVVEGVLPPGQSTDGIEAGKIVSMVAELAAQASAAGEPASGLEPLTTIKSPNLDPSIDATECQADLIDSLVRGGLRGVDAATTTCQRSVLGGKVSLIWTLKRGTSGRSYELRFDETSTSFIKFEIKQVQLPFGSVMVSLVDRDDASFGRDAVSQLVSLMVASNGRLVPFGDF